MKKIIDLVLAGVEHLCKAMLVVQVIAVFIVVVGRQVVGRTPAWGEELTLFCLVWVSMLGAVILLRNGDHIAVTVFDRWLSPRTIRALDLLSHLFLLFFAVMMIVYGGKLLEVTSRNTMSALRIRSSWLYAAVPVSSGGMVIVLLEKIALLPQRKDTPQN